LVKILHKNKKIKLFIENKFNYYKNMKLNQDQLKNLIKEEASRILKEEAHPRDYNFETIEEYFQYMFKTYVDGNKSHSKELYNDLSDIQKERFKEWLKESGKYKESDFLISLLNEQVGIAPETKEEKRESILDARPGEIVILNFEGITIKVQRQLGDLFKVLDASESHKLKDGDYIMAKGNDIFEKGRKFGNKENNIK
jgi:hypothetical protein